jgi:thymidylate synthase
MMPVDHGESLYNMILNLQENVRMNGKPVYVDGKGTIEKLFEQFAFEYSGIINIDNIKAYMKKYYEEKGLDYAELEELEKGEYSDIYDTIVWKSEYFKEDIRSRRVLWTDDCCISMLQYLVRDNKLYCFLHLRSSDIVYKLFSDLHLIHNITRRLQIDLGIYNTIIHVTANSFHEVVIK